MMEIFDYLEPENTSGIIREEGTLIQKVNKKPDQLKERYTAFDVALIGVPFADYSLTDSSAPEEIRKDLYELSDIFDDRLRILDFGNIKRGNTFQDTLIGLRDVVHYLLNKGLFIIVLGGAGIMRSGLIQAASAYYSNMDWVSVEPGISIVSEWEFLPEETRANLSCSVLGTQSYYIPRSHVKWMEEHSIQDIRLGNIRQKLLHSEPILRDAHLTTLSVHSVKHADAPGQIKAMPNGFYSEEISQIARFIGLADNTRVVGLFDYYSENDHFRQTSQLVAQLCWFITEGYLNRRKENPKESEEMKKFIVNQNNSSHELIFYKSEKTERWWMEVPTNNPRKTKVISCSYEDYRLACEQEVPDRWLKAFQKYNL